MPLVYALLSFLSCIPWQDYMRERKRREPVQNMSCFIGTESQKFQQVFLKGAVLLQFICRKFCIICITLVFIRKKKKALTCLMPFFLYSKIQVSHSIFLQQLISQLIFQQNYLIINSRAKSRRSWSSDRCFIVCWQGWGLA